LTLATSSVGFSADSTLIGAIDENHQLQVWTMTGKQIPITRTNQRYADFGFSPTGNTIYAYTTTGSVTVWNARSGQRVSDYAGLGPDITSVEYDGDERLLAVVSGPGYSPAPHLMTVISVAQRSGPLLSVSSSNVLSEPSFSDDGSLVMFGRAGSSTQVYQIGNSERVFDVDRLEDAFRFAPGLERFIVEEDDGKMALRLTATGALVATLGDWDDAAVFDAVSNTIAVSTDAGKVRLYHADNGEPIRVLNGHSGRIDQVSFVTVDGDRLLVTSGEDGVVRTWSVSDR
jgi:WD40 repeat protein